MLFVETLWSTFISSWISNIFAQFIQEPSQEFCYSIFTQILVDSISVGSEMFVCQFHLVFSLKNTLNPKFYNSEFHLCSPTCLLARQFLSKVCGCSSVTFFSGHLYLIGVGSGEDQKTNTIKTHA